jgi:hypothetical protein
MKICQKKKTEKKKENTALLALLLHLQEALC